MPPYPRGGPREPGALRSPASARCRSPDPGGGSARPAQRESPPSTPGSEWIPAPAAGQSSLAARPALTSPKPVAEASHSLDQLAGLLQLGSEPLHVHIHRPGLDVGLCLPDDLQQLGPALHSSSPFHQGKQEFVLGRSETQLPAMKSGAVSRAVDGNGAGAEG